MKPLAELKVLVIEDEMLGRMLLEDLLQELGCTVIGPVASIAAGVELAGGADVDVALLDINIDGVRVYPVADALAQRGIPFAFVTGYKIGAARGYYDDRPAVQKPVRKADLEAVLIAAMEHGGTRW